MNFDKDEIIDDFKFIIYVLIFVISVLIIFYFLFDYLNKHGDYFYTGFGNQINSIISLIASKLTI